MQASRERRATRQRQQQSESEEIEESEEHEEQGGVEEVDESQVGPNTQQRRRTATNLRAVIQDVKGFFPLIHVYLS
jgi:hypothetical protein